ncbi:6639_t:CDS:2, partial [Funneliformis mosseae]
MLVPLENIPDCHTQLLIMSLGIYKFTNPFRILICLENGKLYSESKMFKDVARYYHEAKNYDNAVFTYKDGCLYDM